MKYDILIVVWGQWHLDTLETVTGPTLMAPGNLPRLGDVCSLRIRFFTTPKGVAKLKRMPIVQSMKSCAKVEIEARSDNEDITGDYHMTWWHEAAREAKETGAYFVVVSPDSVWPNGVFGKLPEIFSRPGVTCVAVPYLGVVSESFVPALSRLGASHENGVISLGSREMIDLATRHLAPMTIVRVMGSPHTHPSLAAYWPIPEQGFLHRLTSRELLALDTEKIELTQHFYGANIQSSEEYYLAEDSDDLFMVSVGQLTKYMSELVPNRPPLELDMAASSIKPHNLSPLVWETSNRPLRLKLRDDDRSAWSRAERESGKFMRRMLVTREMLLVREAMGANGSKFFSALLSTAIFVTGLVETWRYKRPVTVFCVIDDAIEESHRSRACEMARPGQEHRLLKAAKNHVTSGDTEFTDGSTARAFGGAELEISFSEARGARINGVKVKEIIKVGKNRLCVLGGCLYEGGIE